MKALALVPSWGRVLTIVVGHSGLKDPWQPLCGFLQQVQPIIQVKLLAPTATITTTTEVCLSLITTTTITTTIPRKRFIHSFILSTLVFFSHSPPSSALAAVSCYAFSLFTKIALQGALSQSAPLFAGQAQIRHSYPANPSCCTLPLLRSHVVKVRQQVDRDIFVLAIASLDPWDKIPRSQPISLFSSRASIRLRDALLTTAILKPYNTHLSHSWLSAGPNQSLYNKNKSAGCKIDSPSIRPSSHHNSRR